MQSSPAHLVAGPAHPSHAARDIDATYRKITWRLLPFLVVAFVVSQIDRANIAFAKLQFIHDLGLSEAAYALGASMFLVGFVLFEVPSNLYLQRVGARATITRIMILWGAVTVATSAVTTPTGLYVMRFLLGAAEAGFFPGVMFYLSQWFPDARRGRIMSIFLMSAALSGVLGGPLAGFIMTNFAGMHALAGWQVLFIYEGIPAILLGGLAYVVMADTPQQAAWLTPREKEIVADALRHKPSGMTPARGLAIVLRDPRVYVACFSYFAIFGGLTTLSYWQPTLIESYGVRDLRAVGLLAAVPFGIAMVAMYLWSRHSDRRGERRWHVAIPVVVMALSYVAIAANDASLTIGLIGLTCAVAASYCAISVFWTIPPAYLVGAAVASGIALINSFGGVAAFLGPVLVGVVKTRTGIFTPAFCAVALLLLISAIALLWGIPARLLRDATNPGDSHNG